MGSSGIFANKLASSDKAPFPAVSVRLSAGMPTRIHDVRRDADARAAQKATPPWRKWIGLAFRQSQFLDQRMQFRDGFTAGSQPSLLTEKTMATRSLSSATRRGSPSSNAPRARRRVMKSLSAPSAPSNNAEIGRVLSMPYPTPAEAHAALERQRAVKVRRGYARG
jgi:hypothetical protein